jgi:hypothetical protein
LSSRDQVKSSSLLTEVGFELAVLPLCQPQGRIRRLAKLRRPKAVEAKNPASGGGAYPTRDSRHFHTFDFQKRQKLIRKALI